MLNDVVEATTEPPYRLRLRFEDGVEGVVDVEKSVSFTGMLAPLRDPDFFARVRVDADLGTVVWPNGADLDPDVLYALVVGEELPRAEIGQTDGWNRARAG
jgi:hypothetical protein